MKFSSIFILLLLSFFANAQDQMFDICPLKVGEEIPDVSITDDKNETHKLSALTAEKPSVIIFYRGAWCGYCTQHLAELNDIQHEIDSLGYQVFGITVDQPEKLEESYAKSAEEIQVYSDASLAAISGFGLDWKLADEQYTKYKESYNLDLEVWSGEDHHSLPVPAIFVVKDQMIKFQYVNPNYKLRLKPETLLAILSTL